MANLYAQASLAAASGETADVNVNIFAATYDGTFGSTQANAWAAAIELFYETVLINAGLKGRAQNGHVIKMYNAVTTTPNYPISEHTFNLASSPGAIDLPLEVNLCVSYQCDSATTVPTRRRRGRIYLSGWGEGQNVAGRPTTTIYPPLAQAYRDYVEDVNAITGMVGCIWSRANASLYPVERVWADDEWDTMRSRGGKATTRSTYLVA